MTRDVLIGLHVRGEIGAEPELQEVCSQRPASLSTSSQYKLLMFSRGDGFSPMSERRSWVYSCYTAAMV